MLPYTSITCIHPPIMWPFFFFYTRKYIHVSSIQFFHLYDLNIRTRLFFHNYLSSLQKKNVKKAAPPCFYPLVVRKRVKTVRKQTPLQLMWILSVPNIKIESNLQWKVFWRHKWRRLCLDNRWIKEERNLHLCLSALQYLVQEPVCF